MLTLGFMTLSLASEHQYFSNIASMAQKHHITCYRFVPSEINPQTEKVYGERYNPVLNDWVKEYFDLPSFLYDRLFYRSDFHSRQCKGIVEWLKTKKNITFLGHGLPNKLLQYSVLLKSDLAPYLPQTSTILTLKDMEDAFKKWNKVIIKPIDGARGESIYLIQQLQKEIIVKTDSIERPITHSFSNVEKWETWLHTLLSKRKFMIQPFLPLQNEERQPFDIRCLLQKNRYGKWTIIGKGVRQGTRDRVVSNLSYGASILPFDTWIQSYLLNNADKQFLENELHDILQTIPVVLENKFPSLFELGVDIGIGKDLSLWVLDCNSKPGHTVITRCLPTIKNYLYESPLYYANWLQERSLSIHE